jgi:hypothetical protein
MQKFLVEDATAAARAREVRTMIVALKRRKGPNAENVKVKRMSKRTTRIARMRPRRCLGKKPKRSMMPDLRGKSRSD